MRKFGNLRPSVEEAGRGAPVGPPVTGQEACTCCVNGEPLEVLGERDNAVTFHFTKVDLALGVLVWRQGAPLGASAMVLVRETT